MMERPSLKINTHLWRFNQARGVYMALFPIYWPFPGVFSSKKRGINRKKQLLLADHFLHQFCQSHARLAG
jgi:hypothetical protein